MRPPFQPVAVYGRMPFMVESSGTSPKMDMRVEAALDWLSERFSSVHPYWFPVTGDASFRRYFRGNVDGQSRILMDAPPETGDSATFVDICGRLRAAGLHAPEIIHYDLAQGFMLLEDLGKDLYRDLLNEACVQPLFDDAFSALATMATEVDCSGLPGYD